MLLGGAQVVVRRFGMADGIDGQVEVVVERLQAGQRARRDARAVVTAHTRDDLFLLRAAQYVVVVTHDFELGFVGVRAGHAVVDFGHVEACNFQHALGKLDLRLVGVAYVGVVVGELKRLLVDSFSHFSATIADVHTVKTRKTVDELTTIFINDINAFTTGNNTARCVAVGEVTQVGGGVEGDFTVAFDQILMQAHNVLSVR